MSKTRARWLKRRKKLWQRHNEKSLKSRIQMMITASNKLNYIPPKKKNQLRGISNERKFLSSSHNLHIIFINFHFYLLLLLISVTKYIRTGIADKDDYPLYFEKAFYETEIDESEEVNRPVVTVTARTHNECKLLTFFLFHTENFKLRLLPLYKWNSHWCRYNFTLFIS